MENKRFRWEGIFRRGGVGDKRWQRHLSAMICRFTFDNTGNTRLVYHAESRLQPPSRGSAMGRNESSMAQRMARTRGTARSSSAHALGAPLSLPDHALWCVCGMHVSAGGMPPHVEGYARVGKRGREGFF